MLLEALGHIFGATDVVSTVLLALQNIDCKHKEEIGGAGGTRTPYLFNAIEALSQLSYSPTGNKYIKALALTARVALFKCRIKRR